MQIVKLDAIDSTNAYIKRTMREKELANNTVVVARDQYEGRGQMGTTWRVEAGKNLTFSLLKKFDAFQAADQFYLSMLVCLSIHKSLSRLCLPDLWIKWPNDILSGNKKVCGVLIETIVSGQLIRSAIIGIGLNVNQTTFPELSGVASLKSLMANSFELDDVLQMLLSDFENCFQSLKTYDFDKLRSTYESKLFMKDTLTSFELDDGTLKEGCIRGISKKGKLLVEFDNGTFTEFWHKEVKLLY